MAYPWRLVDDCSKHVQLPRETLAAKIGSAKLLRRVAHSWNSAQSLANRFRRGRRRTFRFFPNGGWNRRQYSLQLSTKGWPGWVAVSISLPSPLPLSSSGSAFSWSEWRQRRTGVTCWMQESPAAEASPAPGGYDTRLTSQANQSGHTRGPCQSWRRHAIANRSPAPAVRRRTCVIDGRKPPLPEGVEDMSPTACEK